MSSPLTLVSGIVALVSAVAVATAAKQPNIVWFLTDDQDQVLGGSFPVKNGATPMPRTQELMQKGGSMATNMYIHTPICCPSRSELVSGRYYHNIKTVGRGCMHVDEDIVNNYTFAATLAPAGYKVGMFGKYLNSVPNYVPIGFDAFLANGGGTYFSPEFSTYNIDGLPDGGWKGTAANYTTAVVGNLSMHWIEKTVKAGDPFFAYIAPKAAHEPFNPAPWYVDHWDPSWPDHEPRPINWNCSFESRKDHHGNIATEPMLTGEAATVITGVFKNRWRTLMSVDDVIGDVIELCEKLGVADNTYFFYSSDHGFQLGEFNILMDKRNVYEWDIKIHLLARGPGIKPGSTWDSPATQVDMATTWLGLAGIDKPALYDGHSLAPLLITNPTAPNVPESTKKHLAAMGDAATYKSRWRDAVFVEYYYNTDNVKCVNVPERGNYPNEDSYCTHLDTNTACWSGPGAKISGCYVTETVANNFIALRGMTGSKYGNILYAEYETGNLQQAPIEFNDTAVDFHEYYNLDTDEWQMNNLYNGTSKDLLSAMHETLHQWYNCKGDTCP